ncbi:MAG: chemotaxis protein CheW [Anaeromyxobacter sp.]|nr:chemotaxis protein CheW [Anaeromyxobacter sp.]MBL0278616.1 chemotaxis protein CheW [Anaeromyxobacter sp.]
MDFLEIRRKAKERAAARAAAARPAGSPGGSADAAPAGEGAPASPHRALALDPLPLPPEAGAGGPAEGGQIPPARAEAGPAWPERPEELPPSHQEVEAALAWSAGPAEGPLSSPPAEPIGAEEADRLAREAQLRADEQAQAEAELEAKLRDLQAAPDARFSTYRPRGGPQPGAEVGLEGDRAPGPDAEPGRGWAQAPAGGQALAPAPPAGLVAPATPAGADPLDEFFYRPDEPGPDLGSMAAPAQAAAAAPEPEQRVEYLTFLLGAEVYGVEIGRVREVMRSPPITEVPRAPADVLGVITVRGEVVAVFDPRARLGLPPSGPSEGGRVVIVDDGAGPCGLQVDAVASVVRLLPGAVEACPQGIGGAAGDCLEGIGRDRDRIFTILSVAGLLRAGRRPAEARG